MIKKRRLQQNENAVTSTLESLIAIGISLSILISYFYAINSQYTIEDNPATDLATKSAAILDCLVSLQGEDNSLSSEWGGGVPPIDLNYLGLAISPTIEYGIINWNTKIIVDGPYPKINVRIDKTCFLEGTKIVMADGSYKNIEDIMIGDLVKSYNEENQKIVNKKVTRIFHHSPDEMNNYYLRINDVLRVTPNHKIYSNGGWIHAENLQIGDSLFSPLSQYKIYSIEKIYERTMTYNFEVEDNHNYFVAMKSNNALVHNQEINATFNWYDTDGLGIGNKIWFDGTVSTGEDTYAWYLDGGYWRNDPQFEAILIGIHTVTLEVSFGMTAETDSVTRIVYPNALNAEYPNPEPWILTGKNVAFDIIATGDDMISSYGKNYFVKYTDINFPNKIYEVKMERSSDFPLLDKQKIVEIDADNLDPDQEVILYNNMKGWLGLNDDRIIYNYFFSIWIDENSNGVKEVNEIYEFGATPDVNLAKESTKRQVLIYKPPEDTNGNIIFDSGSNEHPSYYNGEIIVSVFNGGTPPSV